MDKTCSQEDKAAFLFVKGMEDWVRCDRRIEGENNEDVFEGINLLDGYIPSCSVYMTNVLHVIPEYGYCLDFKS